MIKGVFKFLVQEDQVKEFKKYMTELIIETRKELGCKSYQLFHSINEKNIYTLIEEWQDEVSLENHMISKHFTEISPKIGSTISRPPEEDVYTLVY